MKKLLLILIVLLISGCSYAKIENEIDFDSGIEVFKGEWLTSYVQLRFDKGYNFGFSFNDSNVAKYPMEHTFYIWDKDLRNELRDTIILIADKIGEMDNNTYQFDFEFNEDFIIKRGKTEVIKLEKDRSTAIIATLLPKSFIINATSFKNSLRIMIIALETSTATSEFETIRIRARMNNDLDLLYNQNYYEDNTLYGFENLEDLNSFLSNKYSPKIENINTGGNHVIELNNSFVDSINQGQYFWIQFTAPTDGYYSFNTDGSKIDTKIEAFSEFNGNVITSGNTIVNIKAKIAIHLTANQIIYLKLYGSNLEDYGIVVMHLSLIE